MPQARSDSLIRQWRACFRRDALAAEAITLVSGRADEIWQHTSKLLRRESPEYRNSIDDEFTRESKSHCHELLRTIVAIAGERPPRSGGDVFDFVRIHARWRARHQVPLIASLHAYRLAHRTYWNLTREVLLKLDRHRRNQTTGALSTLSDFWIEFFDHVAAVLAEAHAVEEGLIVTQGTRTYVSLIDDLLKGREPGRVAAIRLRRLCGLQAGMNMAVVVAHQLLKINGGAVDLEAALRSLLRLVEQALPPDTFGKMVDIRDGQVIAIVGSEREPSRALAEALRRNGFSRRAANGQAAGVGISFDTSDVFGLPGALEEAQIALSFASRERPLVRFADIDLSEFLVRRADRVALRLVPPWARKLGKAGRKKGTLPRTIRAFADCNFNVKQTARRLGVHTNTIYFRLNRIGKLTGVDPRTYAGTARLLTALSLLEIRDNR